MGLCNKRLSFDRKVCLDDTSSLWDNYLWLTLVNLFLSIGQLSLTIHYIANIINLYKRLRREYSYSHPTDQPETSI